VSEPRGERRICDRGRAQRIYARAGGCWCRPRRLGRGKWGPDRSRGVWRARGPQPRSPRARSSFRRRRLANRLEATGGLHLDAPNGGALRGAEGMLTVIALGCPAKATPALRAMVAKIYDLGEKPRHGAAYKMNNQLVVGAHIAAACEAITFPTKQRPSTKVYVVITASAGNSWMFENRTPACWQAIIRRTAPSIFFVKELGIVYDMARVEKFPCARRRPLCRCS
jgi:NAD-binding of NADP-dependent 3-hydroxyisobutyrate dehydrogenase